MANWWHYSQENPNFLMRRSILSWTMRSSKVLWIHFIVFHYYLVGNMDVVYYTMTNALFHTETKTLQLHYILFENDWFKPVKVKGNGSICKGQLLHMSCHVVPMMFGLVDSPQREAWNKTSNIQVGEWFETVNSPGRQCNSSKTFKFLCHTRSWWLHQRKIEEWDFRWHQQKWTRNMSFLVVISR